MASPIAPVSPTTTIPTVAISTPAGWQAAVAKVLKYGSYDESDPMGLPALVVKTVDGPASGTHQVNFMKVSGMPRPDGSFRGSSVNVVSEGWEPAENGNFKVDRWFHDLDVNGTRDHAVRVVLTMNPSGRIIAVDTPRFTEAEAAANLASLVARWSTYGPEIAPSAAVDAMAEDHPTAPKLDCGPLLPGLGKPLPSAGVSTSCRR